MVNFYDPPVPGGPIKTVPIVIGCLFKRSKHTVLINVQL